MTETMKKFKPPFKVVTQPLNTIIWDKNGLPICEIWPNSGRDWKDERSKAVLIAKALNFYYAKKGEKE